MLVCTYASECDELMYRYLLTLELNRGASRRGERPRQQRTRVVFEIIPDSTRFDEIPYGAGLYIRRRELQTFHRQLHPLAVSITLQIHYLHLFHLPSTSINLCTHPTYLSTKILVSPFLCSCLRSLSGQTPL